MTENASTSASNDIFVQGANALGNYTYDANGNMQTDTRKNLHFEYNLLNLPNSVKSGDVIKAKYVYSADGMKLQVRDGDGTNGYDYAGSFVYKKNNLGSKLEADPTNPTFQHEYGHYLQNQKSGPLYLERYGMPSLFSSGDHNTHPVEQDANARSIKYFRKKGIETNWDFKYNPIIGYDTKQDYDSEANQNALNNARMKSFTSTVW